jgi:hypothetical protein
MALNLKSFVFMSMDMQSGATVTSQPQHSVPVPMLFLSRYRAACRNPPFISAASPSAPFPFSFPCPHNLAHLPTFPHLA